ncbi:MAG: hypothetical protein Fur0010_08170 [Bdellovibrio sp.]
MSKTDISGPLTVKLKKGQIICAAGEHDYDLFMVHKGKLLVFVNDGTKITPLAYIGSGEYLGELSFFDKQTRSAHVICVEDSTLIQIPVEELDKQFPSWLVLLAQNLTKKIRKADELIRKKGIRKQNVETIKPLTIEEQRYFYKVLQEYKEQKGLK